VKALTRIYERRAAFVSRGDNSGTHIKERSLWKAAGLKPEGEWYKEAGQGMGAVLTMASELSAYTLTDSGTFYSMVPKLRLAEMVGRDPLLRNPYSVIAVNPARYPHVHYVESMTLIGFLTSPEGQRLIKDFQPTGKPLFWPDAVQEP
jgi:tungstate transport system substrate-binding protein